MVALLVPPIRPGAKSCTPELDALTLERARHGEREAWRALVVRYERPVHALLGRLVGRRGEAVVEDLAQETFLRVFAAVRSFDPGGGARLSTWILTIATRLGLDELRRRPLVLTPLEDARGVAGTDRADADADRRQLAAVLPRALDGLSPEFRAAFLLREVHGLEYGELADALGVDMGTVKSRLARARAALRNALSEVHHDGS